MKLLPLTLSGSIIFSLGGTVWWMSRGDSHHHAHTVGRFAEAPDQSFITSASSLRRQGLQCSSFDEDLMPLLQDSDQVFVLAPAKAGGTSLKHFVLECMGDDPSSGGTHHMDNFINFADGRLEMFYKTIEVPKLVASHIQNNNPESSWKQLLNAGSRRTLVITSFREETERLKSAIHYIVPNKLCDTREQAFHELKEQVKMELTPEKCSVDEEGFAQAVIQHRYQEIGGGVYDQFNCEIWNEIDDTAPRILVVHHSQLQRLQTKLSKHFCPHVKPKALNVKPNDPKTTKKMEYIIRSRLAGRNVTLDEWVDSKLPTLEWAFSLSRGTCKRRTNEMSDVLAACPDQFLRLHPRETL